MTCIDPGDVATLLGGGLVAVEAVLAARRAYAIDPDEASVAARLTTRLRPIDPVDLAPPPSPPRSPASRAAARRSRRQQQARRLRQAGLAPSTRNLGKALAEWDADASEARAGYVEELGQWNDRMQQYQFDRDRQVARARAAALRPSWRLWLGVAVTIGGVFVPALCF
jgi:hypothetical protein